MNTVEMLKLASRSLGIGPHAAMRAAENLYLCGYTSYPRTESSAYPDSYDIRDALRTLSSSHSHVGGYATELLRTGHTPPRSGHDAGDHPPITPVSVPVPGNISGDEARIFDLISRHFLASVSRDATFLVTTATFKSSTGELFSASGKKELDQGFMRVYSHEGQRERNEDEQQDEDEEDENMACQVNKYTKS